MLKRPRGAHQGSIKIWLIFVLIVLIAFFSVALYRHFFKIPAPVAETGVITDEGVSKPKIKDLTRLQKLKADQDALTNALHSSSPEDCNLIRYDAALREKCLNSKNYGLAIQTNNLELCDLLTDEGLKTECYNQVYFSLATKNRDLSLCENITEETMRQNCLDQINYALSLNAHNIEDCDTITNEALKQKCRDNFTLRNTVAKLDPTGCDSITDEKARERCLKSIENNREILEKAKESAQKKVNSSADLLESCEQLPLAQETACKDRLYFDLTLEKKDLSICDQIFSVELKSRCLTELASQINNYYVMQAYHTQDSSNCDRITDPTYKNTCLSYIR